MKKHTHCIVAHAKAALRVNRGKPARLQRAVEHAAVCGGYGRGVPCRVVQRELIPRVQDATLAFADVQPRKQAAVLWHVPQSKTSHCKKQHNDDILTRICNARQHSAMCAIMQVDSIQCHQDTGGGHSIMIMPQQPCSYAFR